MDLTHKQDANTLFTIICVHVEHFSGAAPGVMSGAVHGLVESSSLPVSPPLRWLAADLMGLAAVEEKQWGLVAYALVRTKSSEHTTWATTDWAEHSAATGAAVNH